MPSGGRESKGGAYGALTQVRWTRVSSCAAVHESAAARVKNCRLKRNAPGRNGSELARSERWTWLVFVGPDGVGGYWHLVDLVERGPGPGFLGGGLTRCPCEHNAPCKAPRVDLKSGQRWLVTADGLDLLFCGGLRIESRRGFLSTATAFNAKKT